MRDEILISIENSDEDHFDVDAVLAAHQNREVNHDPILLRQAVDGFLNKSHPFQPLDFVTWKPLMRNRPFPAEGKPAIFIRWLPEPIENLLKTEHGVMVCFNRVDMEIAIMDDEGDLLFCVTDSRRWMPWEAE